MTILPARADIFRVIPKGMVGAEIGVWRGDFSLTILEVSQPKQLWLVDSWEQKVGRYALDPANVPNEQHQANRIYVEQRFSGDPRVKVLRADSTVGMREILNSSGPVDWVYLDADHTPAGISEDLKAAANTVGEKGWILGHDYCVNGITIACDFGVYDAVNRFCLEAGWELVYLTREDWPSYALRKAL